METVTDFIFLGSKITVYGDERHEIKRQLFLGKSYDKPRKHMEKQRHHFVDKVMFLLINLLLPKGKRLLISWLQSPSAVILEPPKIKSDTVSIVSPSIFREMMASSSSHEDAVILVF